VAHGGGHGGRTLPEPEAGLGYRALTMRELAGRTAVITGAASGLGLSMARRARALGMRPVLADVEAGPLARAVAELGGAEGAALGEVVDVADGAQVARLADRAFAATGDVGLLVNNAGVGGGGLVWETSEKEWRWVMGVNLMGVVHGIRHFVPRMLDAERRGRPSHVVNTASIAGWIAPPLLGAYSVSKHAVVALTETLFHDLRLAGSSIGVSLLSPAFVPTGIARSERNRPADLADDGPHTASQARARAAVEKAVTGGRIGADEVARLTFDAVLEDRFYVFTHPQILPSVKARHDAALAGGAPADPYGQRPDRRPGG
jgi:NAD(P)-dependent dehydrogenase (short-subunit alcohol dehydrogenase family)